MPSSSQMPDTNADSGSNSPIVSIDKLQDSIGNIKIEECINGNRENNHEAGEIGDLSHSDNHSSCTDTAVEVAPIQDGNRASDAIPDCIYFLRHGICGYGSTCRYNHRIYTGQEHFSQGSELPERVGQPDCQHFLRTGTCKYGYTCKYNHPKNRFGGDISFNIDGLPIRKSERFCPYYMRTRYCKFGIDCKFSHPQPYSHGSLFSKSGVSSAYPPVVSSMTSPSGMPLIGGGSPAWSPTRPFLFSPYMPFVLPCGQQDWNTYMDTIGPVIPSTDTVMSSPISNNPNHHIDFGSSTTTTTQVIFPERPDQPDCQYYMKNGSCKYGSSCKYHHPRDRITSSAACTVGPLGLPLRPGQATCTFYNTYGTCKYGLGCKFDHPVMSYYNYTDPSILFPSYQRNSPVIYTPPDSTVPKTLKLTTTTTGDDGITKSKTTTTTTTTTTIIDNDTIFVSEASSVVVSPPPPQSSSSTQNSSLPSPGPIEQSD